MNDDIMRMLSDMRYVLELRKNLIPSSTLDILGCLYQAKGIVLGVFRGILIVMKRKLKNGLYILQGNTIVGVASISSIFDYDQTCLWHMRFKSYE